MNTSPKLAAPGAGLPLVQSLFVRYWLGPVVSKKSNLKEVRVQYEKLTDKIIKVAQSIPTDKRQIPVLVEPQPGLEDSSRFWSTQGVLEHLLTVSKGIERITLSLAANQYPVGEVSVADVKPKNKDHDYLPEFIEYAPKLLERIDAKVLQENLNLENPMIKKHPWMGNFNAHQWYWLTASHQGIHYQQLKGIRKGLELK